MYVWNIILMCNINNVCINNNINNDNENIIILI